MHAEYPANTCILPVMDPCMFPAPEFYLHAFERGIDGIFMLYTGTDNLIKVDLEPEIEKAYV